MLVLAGHMKLTEGVRHETALAASAITVGGKDDHVASTAELVDHDETGLIRVEIGTLLH